MSMPSRLDARVLEQARDAYRAARYREAAELLDAAPAAAENTRAFLLQARILRCTAPSEAIARLERETPNFEAAEERAEALVLLGGSQARLRDFASAESSFKRARELLRAADGPDTADLADEVAYRSAALQWRQGRPAEAAATLAPVLERPETRFFVIALVLRAAIHGACDEYERQASLLMDALAAVAVDPRPDVARWGLIVCHLARLAGELPDPILSSTVARQLRDVPWTPDLARFQATALRNAARQRGLEADYAGAFRLYRQASALAASGAPAVQIACDRAQLAQALGERHFAEGAREEATALAESVDWNAVPGEDRFALLGLAESWARVDPSRALGYIVRFQNAGLERPAATTGSGRVRAALDAARGVVETRLGKATEGRAHLLAAWSFFARVGFDWRAACAAADLYRLTSDAIWLERAREKLAAYPRSWLARELALPPRADAPPALERLTPAQERVYELLRRGYSNADIARELDRSEHTVRNHIKAVFKRLTVTSRSQLIRQTVAELSGRREP
jgi:DNA-binding CsgD family transcriptional regulator